MSWSRRILALGAGIVALGCVEFSPFETDLAEEDRNQTAKNLARLEARPEPAGPWKLAAISDSHSYYSELDDLIDILNERDDLELVLHAGDLTDYGLRQEYRWALDRLRRLDVPWLTVIGNHDALTNGADVYRNMFGSSDYAFAWGGLHFVLFNSNRLELDSKVPNWPFVEGAVLAAEGAPTLVLTHLAPETVEFPDPERFAALLALPGVVASIHGHLHEPGRRDVGPVPSVVIGTAASLHHLVVSFDGADVSIERCRGRSCTPLEASP